MRIEKSPPLIGFTSQRQSSKFSILDPGPENSSEPLKPTRRSALKVGLIALGVSALFVRVDSENPEPELIVPPDPPSRRDFGVSPEAWEKICREPKLHKAALAMGKENAHFYRALSADYKYQFKMALGQTISLSGGLWELEKRDLFIRRWIKIKIFGKVILSYDAFDRLQKDLEENWKRLTPKQRYESAQAIRIGRTLNHEQRKVITIFVDDQKPPPPAQKVTEKIAEKVSR